MSDTSVTVTYTDWEDDLVIPPLLKTSWHQYYPYNALAPLRKEHIFYGPSAHAPIGCVPLAAAQVFASLSRRGLLLKDADLWSILGEVPRVYPFSSASIKTAIAKTLQSLARKTVIWASYHFSLGSPLRALRLFKEYRFSQARLKWFNKNDKEDIVRMLKEGKPVLIMGLDLPVEGHAWVADGFFRRKRNKVTSNDKGELIVEETETEDYLHCNFGWGGAANGFYPFGSFDTRTGPVFRDPKTDTYGGKTASRNFTALLHFIAY